MTTSTLLIVTFEANVLFQLFLPRISGDRLTTRVMDGPHGSAALRIFRATLAATAVAGGMAIAMAPEDGVVFPFLIILLMMWPPLVGFMFHLWLRRAVLALEGERLPRRATLDLNEEPIPRVAWLAAVPPFITVGLIYWLASHWSAFTVRDGPATSAEAWQHPEFRSIVHILIMSLGWSVFAGILVLAMWYGVSRQYAFRKPQLHFAIALSWFQTLTTPAWVLPLWLRLPPLGWLLCAAAGAIGVGLLARFGPLARRQYQAANMPPSSYGLYFDRNDPSFFGERGMNLASPWNWALFVAPVALFGLPVLLTFW